MRLILVSILLSFGLIFPTVTNSEGAANTTSNLTNSTVQNNTNDTLLNQAIGLNHKGLTLANLHKNNEAITAYDKALATNSTNIDALDNRNQALAILKKHTTIITQSQSDHNVLTNETFLESPNDETLAEAISNMVPLSSYTIPKTSDLIIVNGSWTMQSLHNRYPQVIDLLISDDGRETFLIKKTIAIGKNTNLRISNCKVLLQSSSTIKDNIPTVIITYGNITTSNSIISSWDPHISAPDPNPYHPRPFLVAKNGGIIDILNSTISYLGFSQGGIHTLESSLAGVNYYNTSDFRIANSTIAHNLYGFYSDNSSKFKITGNKIYDHTGYGLDPHTGSKDFIIDSNHVFLSGQQGIICSYMCKNATITNNVVEYNVEGIGLDWLTNSSLVQNNIIKYNKNVGAFIKTNSFNNKITNNTILGNGHGIRLLNNSNYNVIRSNNLIGNILDKNPIYADNSSKMNFIKGNIVVIK